MKNNLSGKLAELLALLYLLFRGYRYVAHNQKFGKGTHAGEVDIIVRRKRTLVFVEVKKRSSMERAAYAVSETQKQRIIRGAEAFLRKKHPKYDDYNIRFDAILIRFPFHLRHLENAWVSTRLF